MMLLWLECEGYMVSNKPVKPTTKPKPRPRRIPGEPIIGRAERSGTWGSFSLELSAFTLNGEKLDPVPVAEDVAAALVWIINNRRAHGSH